jgi:hypothetical protein
MITSKLAEVSDNIKYKVTCTLRRNSQGKNWSLWTKKKMMVIKIIILFRVKIGRRWRQQVLTKHWYLSTKVHGTAFQRQ